MNLVHPQLAAKADVLAGQIQNESVITLRESDLFPF